jgi:hypothetical protein
VPNREFGRNTDVGSRDDKVVCRTALEFVLVLGLLQGHLSSVSTLPVPGCIVCVRTCVGEWESNDYDKFSTMRLKLLQRYLPSVSAHGRIVCVCICVCECQSNDCYRNSVYFVNTKMGVNLACNDYALNGGQ